MASPGGLEVVPGRTADRRDPHRGSRRMWSPGQGEGRRLLFRRRTRRSMKGTGSFSRRKRAATESGDERSRKSYAKCLMAQLAVTRWSLGVVVCMAAVVCAAVVAEKRGSSKKEQEEQYQAREEKLVRRRKRGGELLRLVRTEVAEVPSPLSRS